jgi:predicted component of type VI protein secretion system
MEKPLQEHISKLEARLEKLSVLIMQNKASREQTNQLEAEIRAVNLALSHYRAALEIEQTLHD